MFCNSILEFLLQTSEDQAMHVMAAAIRLDLVTSSTQHESTSEPTRPDPTQPRFPTGMACCGVAEVALQGGEWCLTMSSMTLWSSCFTVHAKKTVGDVWRPFASLHLEVLAIFQCGGSICHGKISEIACVEPEPVKLHFAESQPKLLNGEWHKGGTFQNSTSFHLQIVHVDMPLWAKIHKRTPCSSKE